MTAQTCIFAQHATLSTTVADSVTFSGQGSTLCITNRDSSVTLYFTMNGTAVSAADDTYAVLPLQSKTLAVPSAGGAGALIVSIVGNGNAYSAEIF